MAAEARAFRTRVEEAIERDDPVELMDVALDIGIEADARDWAQSCCIQLARHRNAQVRGNAVLAFGHLARRFGQLDPQRVRRLVEIALHDPSDYVRAQAASAADDLTTFLSWDFDRPE
jgi:HEAT repeat protein